MPAAIITPTPRRRWVAAVRVSPAALSIDNAFAFPIASPAAAASPRPQAGRGRQRFARKSLPGEGAATALGLGGLVCELRSLFLWRCVRRLPRSDYRQVPGPGITMACGRKRVIIR